MDFAIAIELNLKFESFFSCYLMPRNDRYGLLVGTNYLMKFVPVFLVIVSGEFS